MRKPGRGEVPGIFMKRSKRKLIKKIRKLLKKTPHPIEITVSDEEWDKAIWDAQHELYLLRPKL